jgi:hypothetical protein
MTTHHYFCKCGSFEYEDLDIEWEASSYDGDLEIEFKAFPANAPHDVTSRISDNTYQRILDKCWEEYWRQHA